MTLLMKRFFDADALGSYLRPFTQLELQLCGTLKGDWMEGKAMLRLPGLRGSGSTIVVLSSVRPH